MGADRKAWQWGKLHSYQWNAANGQALRAPLQAGGDHSTLNGAAYRWGQDFAISDTPALRFIVDFGQPEPLTAMNSTGQSGNPASPFYANGIDGWLKGQYLSLPLQPQNFARAYGSQRLTLVPGK